MDVLQNFVWPLLALVLTAALVGVFGRSQSSPKFVRKPLLTSSEARVLGFLERALPHHRVMAQVSMGALLKAGEADRNRAHSTRNRFAQKIVDFVIVTRDTADVVALVELDDRTHRAALDAKRDAMTAAAGYRTIRIPGRPRPTAETVRSAVAELQSAGTTVVSVKPG